jgi:CRP-like cAMP-binding protein
MIACAVFLFLFLSLLLFPGSALSDTSYTCFFFQNDASTPQFHKSYLHDLSTEKLLNPPIKSVKKHRGFNPQEFLATIGEGRKPVVFSAKQAIFTQGNTCDSIFYIQQGKVRLTVVSQKGKEATLAI